MLDTERVHVMCIYVAKIMHDMSWYSFSVFVNVVVLNSLCPLGFSTDGTLISFHTFWKYKLSYFHNCIWSHFLMLPYIRIKPFKLCISLEDFSLQHLNHFDVLLNLSCFTQESLQFLWTECIFEAINMWRDYCKSSSAWIILICY